MQFRELVNPGILTDREVAYFDSLIWGNGYKMTSVFKLAVSTVGGRKEFPAWRRAIRAEAQSRARMAGKIGQGGER